MQYFTQTELERIAKAKTELTQASKNGVLSLSFSGGKDSTCVLFLILDLMKSGDLDLNKINIVHSDTTIEYPHLSNLTFRVLDYLETGFNLEVNIVRANPEKRFFALMFGRGYPRPMHSVRWCTQYLKIEPQKNFRKLQQNSIVVTGEHLGESSKRDTRLKKLGCGTSECGLKELSTSAENVLRPIMAWEDCQIWDYLKAMDGKLLWENMVYELDRIYKNTESVASLRTGCIACPVISKSRHESTESKGIPSELSLALYKIYDVLSADKYRLKNPKINKLHPELKDYRDNLKVKELTYQQLKDFFQGREYEISYKKNGLYNYGAIALPVRKIMWRKVEQLIPEFKKSGVDLISVAEHKFILDALNKGLYPKTYQQGVIQFLEEEWRNRTGFN